MKILALILGGSLGTIARYYLGGWVYSATGPRFPYGTLVVNTLGCLIVGTLYALSEKKFLLGPGARLFWMVGFCGAFTTFSTFALETMTLATDGQFFLALGNVVLSLVLGLVFFRLGYTLGLLI